MSEVLVHYQDYEELKRMMRESGRDYDTQLIEKAYNLASEAQGDQRRVSGVPYIPHPTSVACILVDLGMDSETVVAALLHDVVEDTDVTLEEIIKLFGDEIAHLIDGVTKLKKIPYSNREVRQAENIRKMLIAMSDDIRVIIIKLADRLHNMRTIECMREQKRRDIALETMEVFAPIAHRLGIRTVKEEMEDLSLRYLDPIGYKEIEDKLAFSEPERKKFIERIKKEIVERAKGIVDDIYIEGRVKSINGIYKKTFMKGKSIEQIYDIFAVRVIVNTVSDCYNILGVVHDMFKPLPNRFKDYISTPKPNMYQSLHTTVIGKEGVPFEVQIRTWEMHHTAEYGIAAHWKYKLGLKGKSKDDMSEKVQWIRQILENQLDDETDIIRNIKTDLAPEEVFIFTPKGDVLSLPTGATVIDVAYAIHSAVGNRMIGAKVDGRIMPIDYHVKTGEIIEILTSKETAGPKRDWLAKVKTSEARNKIKSWFKKECREENIERGKAEIDKEFKHNGIVLTDDERVEFFLEILKKQFTGLQDFYAAVGYGGFLIWKLGPRMRELYNKKYKPQLEAEEEPVVETKPVKASKSSNGVIVEGIDDMLVNLARCCNPMRGDEIIGYITRGNGVSIHKCSCKNVPDKEERDNSENAARWVNAHWDDEVSKAESYQATVEVSATDRTGLIADVTNVLSSLHIYIHSINSSESKNGVATIRVTITVSNMEHLKGILSKLSSINGVQTVARI